MIVIGITGGVGSGKSEVLKYLGEHYDAAVIQADTVGHLLMRKGNCCYQPVIDLLGSSIIEDDGELGRRRIAALVYADDKLLAGLNQIIHPAVKSCISQEMAREEKLGRAFFFVEAALLLEDHYDRICDEIWYIYAEEAVRRARLKMSRGYSEEKISGILKNQLSEAEFRSRCQYTIDNSGNFENTKIQIDARMQKYENV